MSKATAQSDQSGVPPDTSLIEISQGRIDYLERFVHSRLGRKFLDIAYETSVMIFYIGAIALLEYILDKLLGKDAKFFNLIPIAFIIDFAHVLVISRFLLEIAKDIVMLMRNFFTVETR